MVSIRVQSVSQPVSGIMVAAVALISRLSGNLSPSPRSPSPSSGPPLSFCLSVVLQSLRNKQSNNDNVGSSATLAFLCLRKEPTSKRPWLRLPWSYFLATRFCLYYTNQRCMVIQQSDGYATPNAPPKWKWSRDLRAPSDSLIQ